MVAALMGLVGYQLLRLRETSRRAFSARGLRARLVVLFALVAVLPGALLYGVSVQFLGKSIESWFDVRVDRALEGGLNLGRGALDYLLKETTNKATQLALTLQEPEAGNDGGQAQPRQRAGRSVRSGALLSLGRRARRRRRFRLDADAGAAVRRRPPGAPACSRPIPRSSRWAIRG